MKIAIINLARLGDVAHILPVAYELFRRGHDVHFYVSGDFSAILEAVSYVTPHALSIGYRDVAGAVEQAKRDGCEKVLATQVDGNSAKPPVETANFTLQQWARAGVEWLAEYHNLPLVFDRRDKAAEQEAIARCLRNAGDQPVLAYNLHSHSSPFLYFAAFERWIKATFAGKYILVDIGPTGAPCRKPQHLLGLIERASILITVDTATLHLGYATRTPTIALSAGKTPDGRASGQYDSEPRRHWIAKLTYAEASTDEGKAKIVDAIRHRKPAEIEAVILGRKDRVWHALDFYLGNNPEENRRVQASHLTREWQVANDGDYSMRLHQLQPGQRSSKDLGDTRTLPYIKDIIDFGCAAPECKDTDIVLFSNSDVCLCREAVDEVRRKLRTSPCCYSRRVEVSRAEISLSLADLKLRESHVGADLFAFRAGWWKEHREEICDVLLSCEGWDAVCRWWMLKHAKNAEMNPPIIYHESHQSFWERPDIIHDNPGQKLNRAECEKWARENGCERALYGKSRPPLFMSDKVWMQAQ